MSRLVPGLIPLNTGLNLQTPKIMAPQGSVLDSLNYEQVDFQGQKRIDGYSRFDGQVLADIDTFLIIKFQAVSLSDVDALLPGARVFLGSGTGLVGIVTSYYLDLDSGEVFVTIAAVDHTINVEVGNILSVANFTGETTTFDVVEVITSQSYAQLRDADAPEAFQYEHTLDNNEILRGIIGGLPGPIGGLHWFDTSLYAVAPLASIEVDLIGTLPVVGSIISAGLAAYASVVAVDASVLSVIPANYSMWSVYALVGASLYDDAGVSFGTVSAIDFIETVVDEADTLDGGYTSNTLYRSMTEQQAFADSGDRTALAGWRAIHLGWKVPFENGLSLYGSLPSLEQNIQGVGIQGPTPISGSFGRPLFLTQKVVIEGAPTQVNGWKNSETPASYTLDVSKIETTDSDYIYADAFVSWDTDSTTVEAPGATSPPLEQYPATSDIRVIL